MIRQMIWAGLLSCFALPIQAADQRFIGCISDFGNWCGIPTHVFFGCRARLTPDQMANIVCGIHTETGVQYFPHKFNAMGVVAGGYCGWRSVEIICHMPEDSEPEWHVDICQGERPNGCGRMGLQHFGCNATPEQIAKRYCDKDGVFAPYQFFKSSDKKGGKCGYATITVGCHVPKR
jgi:hypothetical protein